ncbi:glycine cleavage system H protein-like [Ptychodera flava]|uniref:glycine cleavage system H protein-like n=1 Tax=Ptychodera flava TaxID=63121 RepID=UPI00396A1444
MASVMRLGLQRLAFASSRCIAAKTLSPRLLIPSARYSDQASKILDDRRYTDKHEWIKLDGDVGTVGISDYAQDLLGEVVYVNLPDLGATFDQEDEFGAVESVKAASELYCPMSGEVVEVNSALEDKPSLINSSPYDEGWVMKIKIESPEQFNELKDSTSYGKFLEEESN